VAIEADMKMKEKCIELVSVSFKLAIELSRKNEKNETLGVYFSVQDCGRLKIVRALDNEMKKTEKNAVRLRLQNLQIL
jgi:hypothetical protein